MACATCGGGNSSKIIYVPPVNNSDNTNDNPYLQLNMTEWILSLGWTYIGKCGCADNKSLYMNSSIPKWQIQISPLSNRLEVWQLFGQIDKKQRGIGGVMNFKEVYDYWINKSLDIIKF